MVGGDVQYEDDIYEAWSCTCADGRTWKAVRDRSIGAANTEIVSPILTYPNDVATLQQVIRAVRKSGARVNSSCGIHVHVDAISLNGRQLGNLAKIVYKQEPLIIHALQISSDRMEMYTKPMETDFIEKINLRRPQTLTDLNRLWYGGESADHQHYHESRYHGVNFHSLFYRGTIEFRWFEATLHAGKIKSYLQYCLLLLNRAEKVQYAASKKRCFNPSTAKYDMRVHLLRLGAIGDEFKTMRHFLLENMPGCASYKNGLPKPKKVA